ncbi:hypothetical protein DPMN_071891 [Dreissena polymorpha]|uniref:Uncharacterized protein n=1 Tax=Dreissena polymorpha TaxID=45954 RepID=A0A9D3Z343_DREPO|nr:hypothetical protein DPMN_071891 [Dreissena polymorpha]
MNDIVMARTSLFRPPASQPASPPAFANLITSFFLRKTWLKIVKSLHLSRQPPRSDLTGTSIVVCESKERQLCMEIAFPLLNFTF